MTEYSDGVAYIVEKYREIDRETESHNGWEISIALLGVDAINEYIDQEYAIAEQPSFDEQQIEELRAYIKTLKDPWKE